MKRPALLLILAMSTVATAADVARTRDGDRWLISKQLDGEEWLISYDADRGMVSGTVLGAAGRRVLLDCEVDAHDSINFYLGCYEAIPNGWAFIANTQVARSFLGFPDNPRVVLPTPRPTSPPQPTPFRTPRPTPTPPRTCPDVAGFYGATASYTCGFGTGNAAVYQSGCEITINVDSVSALASIAAQVRATMTPGGHVSGVIELVGECTGELPIVNGSYTSTGGFRLGFDSVLNCTGSAAGCGYSIGTLTIR